MMGTGTAAPAGKTGDAWRRPYTGTPAARLHSELQIFADARGRQIAVAVAVVAAILCFIPALRDGFALDDMVIVYHNARIHQLSTLGRALAVPYWYDEQHLYRPLTTLAFGLEWILGGGRPIVFHAINVLWHATVCALLVLVALRWWPPIAAGAAGLWFAVHPVHAEPVTNIVGRSELVCAAGLLAIVLVASGRSDRTHAGPESDRRHWWMVFLFAAIAMASKEVGAVAPFVAWAAAITPVPEAQTSMRAGDRRRAWRLTSAAASGVAFLLAARFIVLGSLAGDAPAYAFSLVHGLAAIRLALAYIPTALALMLVPQPPGLDYSPSEAIVLYPPVVAVALGAGLVIAALAVFIWHVRAPSRWTFAACFAAATFAPVSNLVVRTGIIVADRTLYSPSAGIALVVGGALAALWCARSRLLLGGAALVTAIGAGITEQAIPAWRDSPSAFEAMRVRSPGSFLAHYTVAKLRDLDGNPVAARQEYDVAIALVPHHASVLYMAGTNALRLRDTTRAIALLRRSVANEPEHARARTALARLTLSVGDTAGAVRLLRDGLALDSTQRMWRREIATLAGQR